MKFVHNIKLSAFSYEDDGEDTQKIAGALTSLCPFNLGQEKLTIKRTNAQGFKERRIVILALTLTKDSHTSKFLKHLKENLSKGHRNLILSQAESRLDGELNFFIRLDKARILKDKTFYITDSGNCFHIKMSIAAYPSNRDKALEVVKDWLESQ